MGVLNSKRQKKVKSPPKKPEPIQIIKKNDKGNSPTTNENFSEEKVKNEGKNTKKASPLEDEGTPITFTVNGTTTPVVGTMDMDEIFCTNSVTQKEFLNLEQKLETKSAKTFFFEVKKELDGKTVLDVEEFCPISLSVDESMLYQLGELVGSGGFGVVRVGYLKIDEGTVLQVAVKILKIDGVNLFVDNVKDEVDVMRKAKHDNVLRCFGCYFKKEGNKEKKNEIKSEEEKISTHEEKEIENNNGIYTGYIVSELCREGDLRNFMRNLGSLKGRLDCLIQIATGIRYLHEKNICHMDLKPDNVLVKRTNIKGKGEGVLYKICDFGSSRNNAKVKNAFCGTVEYMAPEQCGFSSLKKNLKTETKQNVDKDLNNTDSNNEKNISRDSLGEEGEEASPVLCDVYSFGIITWEVMSNLRPYKEMKENFSSNIIPMLFQIHERRLRPDILKMVGAPKKLKLLVEKCWQHDPNLRPQSFSEILKELNEIFFETFKINHSVYFLNDLKDLEVEPDII